MLDIKNIEIYCANKFLDYKNLGLFKILRTINNLAYKQDLPQFLSGIFLVLYLQFFHLNKKNTLSNQIIALLATIWFNKKVGLEKYIVKEIFDLQIDKKEKTQLIVKQNV